MAKTMRDGLRRGAHSLTVLALIGQDRAVWMLSILGALAAAQQGAALLVLALR